VGQGALAVLQHSEHRTTRAVHSDFHMGTVSDQNSRRPSSFFIEPAVFRAATMVPRAAPPAVSRTLKDADVVIGKPVIKSGQNIGERDAVTVNRPPGRCRCSVLDAPRGPWRKDEENPMPGRDRVGCPR
jgi:hypothetical protein